MKHTTKLACLLLALVMILALTIPAFGAESYSITVNNTNTAVSISGSTYSAYKIFDVTYSSDNQHYSYTINDHFKNFTYTAGEKSYSGEELISYINSLSNNADALNSFAKAALAYATATENSITADGTVTIATSAQTGTINLSAPGYYLVAGGGTSNGQTITAACSLTTTAPTATINPKLDAPSVDKKIVEDDQKVEANSAAIGDNISYEVTSKVPNMTGYNKYYFILNDTMSKGLTFNGDVSIKVGSTELIKDNDYTVASSVASETGITTITITFKNFINYTVGADIVVTYSATLNENADLTQTGNINNVNLTYSNNPNFNYAGESGTPEKDEPTGTTPNSTTKTYSTGLKLTKVDSSQNPLTGAKFQIAGEALKVVLINKESYVLSENGTYYMLKDGTFTKTAPADESNESYDSITNKYTKITTVTKNTVTTPINTSAYVDSNGVLTFEGLGAGTYTITELIAPSGYNMLKSSITITITSAPTLSGCTWTVKNGETGLTANNNLYSFSVVNTTGTELPTTGGIGTTIFYVAGSLLVLGAVVLLVTKKRMNGNA